MQLGERRGVRITTKHLKGIFTVVSITLDVVDAPDLGHVWVARRRRRALLLLPPSRRWEAACHSVGSFASCCAASRGTNRCTDGLCAHATTSLAAARRGRLPRKAFLVPHSPLLTIRPNRRAVESALENCCIAAEPSAASRRRESLDLLVTRSPGQISRSARVLLRLDRAEARDTPRKVVAAVRAQRARQPHQRGCPRSRHQQTWAAATPPR